MPKKPRERYKDRARADAAVEPESKPKLTPEALRKRRNRRFIFLAIIAVLFPILEVVAYQFRAITITLSNRSDEPIGRIKLVYTGGSIEAPELKPGDSITRVVRPDFTFKGDGFATYWMTVQFSTARGSLIRRSSRVGSIDFSAHERYVVEPGPPDDPMVLKHSTSPGFPLNLIRDLMDRLGIG